MVTNLIPYRHLLPFFSYGGTALMIQLAEMGIILSVSRQIPAPRQSKRGPGRTLFPCAARDSGVLRRRMSCCAHPLNFFHPMAGEAF